MLPKASNEAGTRLHRSKSASACHRRSAMLLEPLDPEVARQHALAAATAAFARAQPSDIAARKLKRSTEMSRSKSNASRKSLTSQGSHFPPRDPSLRSLQHPKAGPQSISHQWSRIPETNTEQFPPFHRALSTDRSVPISRPGSAQPSITLNEDARPRTQPRPHRQSASSSIASQQLRKARSMYYASNVQTGSPIARPPVQYLETPPSINGTSALESVTMSPATRKLEPSPLSNPRIPVTVAADETLDEARDKYLQSFQRKTVKHKPSIFLAPFRKRQDKAKDIPQQAVSGLRSASVSSQQTPVESLVDPSITKFLPPSKIKEKRSLSGSLRSKFKKVFKRPSNKMPHLPVQHIDASRDYFMLEQPGQPPEASAYGIPSPDEELLQRVRSRAQTDPRSKSRNSSSGSTRSDRSNRSLHSEVNATHLSASRMTSWATTSTGDAQARGSIKRLTVIHEAKDSAGSEADHLRSLMPRRKSLLAPMLSAFHEPMPAGSPAEESLAFVDPKRVFSALMREIGTANSTNISTDIHGPAPGVENNGYEATQAMNSLNQAKEMHSNAHRGGESRMSSHHEPISNVMVSGASKSIHGRANVMRSLGRAIKSTIRTVTPSERQPSNSPGRAHCDAMRRYKSTSPSPSTLHSDETTADENQQRTPPSMDHTEMA